jgi:hypothetical protein
MSHELQGEFMISLAAPTLKLWGGDLPNESTEPATTSTLQDP